MTTTAELAQELYGPSARRSTIRQLPRLLRESWRLVRATSARDFVVSVAVQLITGLASGGVLLAGRDALSNILAADTGRGDFAAVLPGFLAAAVLGVLMKAGATLQGERQQLLALSVSQQARDQVLEVAATVDLHAFDDPAFYDRFMRAGTCQGL